LDVVEFSCRQCYLHENHLKRSPEFLKCVFGDVHLEKNEDSNSQLYIYSKWVIN